MQRNAPQIEPPLPRHMQDSVESLGMGLLNKIILCYNEPWWERLCALDVPGAFFVMPTATATKEDGYMFPHEGIPATKDDAMWLLVHHGIRVQNYRVVSGANVLVCFAGPPLAQAVEMLEEAWVVGTIHQRLVQSLLGSEVQQQAAPPTSSAVTRWQSDPCSCGSYAYWAAANPRRANRASGPRDMEILSRPVWEGRLGFCGEHTEPDW